MFEYIKNKIDSFMRKVRSTGSIPKIQPDKNEAPSIEKYQFVNKHYTKYLNCPICKTLMKNAQRLHPCGHTLCFTCAPKKGKCPTCSTKIETAQKDLVGQGLINEMMVRCLNNDCPFRGTYQDYKKFHQKSCKLGDKGLDQWIKSMQGTLDQNVFNHKNDDSQKQQQAQNEQKQIRLSSSFKRPKSPQKAYDFEQQLLQKSLKSQL